MKARLFALLIVLSFVGNSESSAASIDKAAMLHQHGLTKEATGELIDIVFSKASNSTKAQAYYLLGSMAFESNRISVALDSWRHLTSKYPNSEEAKLVKDRMVELAEIVDESVKESIGNAVAQSYLRHGDFWSKGKSRTFTIDSSWISNTDGAIKWYDRVIREFPKSAASRVAYQDKLRTLLGWKDSGRHGSKHGIEASFHNYMPVLLETFASFENEHPDASTLQSFRYQIGQAYWKNRNWGKTREWMNLIIENSGGRDSFYLDLARRRLKKVEY